MEALKSINSAINSFVWGPVMLALLVGTGVYFSFRIGFPQLAHFGHAMKNTLGKVFVKTTAGKGEMTPFQAVSTALASTVGTGNIAGVTGAIVLGGPGAVLWMWVSAFFGMCTKFCEVTLALKYRERNAEGDWVGGPMYYIKNGLGAKWKWLGVLFAFFGALCAFGIGNLTQINSIASTVCNVAQVFTPNVLSEQTLFIIALVTGIVVAVFAAITLIGGVSRIGQVTERMVPFMAVVYIICSLVVVIVNIKTLPSTLSDIFKGAFNPQAAVGGIAGFTVMNAMKRGVARGVFSNEAGLGSAPMAHASSSETNPVKQGLYGIFEVFIDTIVVCTLTALVVLQTGVADFGNKDVAGSQTTVLGFQSVYGDKLGSVVLALGLFLFASSTILGWALYGVRCAEFLFGPKIIRPYEILFCIVVVIGSITELPLVWDIADTLNGLMAIPNLIALLALSPVVIKLAREYFADAKKK